MTNLRLLAVASASLLFLAPTPAAAAGLTFGVGYGGARLEAGKTASPYVVPRDVSGEVTYSRISFGYEAFEGLAVETSYFTFSKMETTQTLDFSNGIPLLSPNNHFRRDARAYSVGMVYSMSLLGPLGVDLGGGMLVSDLRMLADGGQEGPRRYRTTANIGYTLSAGVSLSLAHTLSVGVAARYLNFGGTIVSSQKLTSGQGEVYATLRF